MKTPTKNKGFTLIELVIVLAIVGIVVSMLLGGKLFMSDAERHNKCVAGATHIHEDDRMPYCIDKIKEEDRNTAIRQSGY